MRERAFHGAVLESLMAGTPIIASNWKYNSDIIQDGVNGIILKENNRSCLVDTLETVLLKKQFLEKKMQQNCLNEANAYKEENATMVLFNVIGLENEGKNEK